MPPAFVLSQDQTLKFNLDLIAFKGYLDALMFCLILINSLFQICSIFKVLATLKKDSLLIVTQHLNCVKENYKNYIFFRKIAILSLFFCTFF